MSKPFLGPATFSPCGTWRYTLERTWGKKKPLVVIGCNPSTASEYFNDPTVLRCIKFADSFGFGGLVMMNLFAFRATNPKKMKAAPDPVGPENDKHLIQECKKAGMILAAWGCLGFWRGRVQEVLKLGFGPMHCLKPTKEGHPFHPLYVAAATKPILWAPPACCLRPHVPPKKETEYEPSECV